MPFLSNGGGLLIPPIKKADRSYGILSSIEPIYFEDPHWQTGVEIESDCSVEAATTLLSCPDPVDPMGTGDGLLFCASDPFTVYGSFSCSTGGRSAEASMTIATNRLTRNKERGVEQTFWTGTTPVGTINPSLQGGNSSCGITPTDLTPEEGPLSPVSAVAALESNMVDCIPGGVGVLHVNYGLLPYLSSKHLVTEKEGKLYTPSGQLIIAGAGYPTSGPANVPAAPGETWLFATGPMAVYTSDVFYNPPQVNEGIDRSLNTVTYRAEQTYAVIFECCLWAVRVQLC